MSDSVPCTHGGAAPEVRPLGWPLAAMYDVCSRPVRLLEPESISLYETVAASRDTRRFARKHPEVFTE